jgi:hypothetical protein
MLNELKARITKLLTEEPKERGWGTAQKLRRPAGDLILIATTVSATVDALNDILCDELAEVVREHEKKG